MQNLPGVWHPDSAEPSAIRLTHRDASPSSGSRYETGHDQWANEATVGAVPSGGTVFPKMVDAHSSCPGCNAAFDGVADHSLYVLTMSPSSDAISMLEKPHCFAIDGKERITAYWSPRYNVSPYDLVDGADANRANQSRKPLARISRRG